MKRAQYVEQLLLMEEILTAFRTLVGVCEENSSPEEIAPLLALQWLKEESPRMHRIVQTVLEGKRVFNDHKDDPGESLMKTVAALERGLNFLRFVQTDADPWLMLELGARHGPPHLPRVINVPESE